MASPRTSIFSQLSAKPSTEERRSLLRQLIAIFLAISLLNLLGAYQRTIVHSDTQPNVQRMVHSWDGWVWYVWLLAAPATLLLIRRFPWRREEPLHSLTPLVIGSAGIYLTLSNLRYLLRVLPNLWLPDSQNLQLGWANYFHTEVVLLPVDFITYCCFFAISFGWQQWHKSRRRTEEMLRLQLDAAKLQSDLDRAQYAVLLCQLQPHFLFNAFNAISGLMRQRQIKPAVQMVAELSELLRMSMERLDEHEVPLQRDLAFVRHYLNIESVRFGDKLKVEFAIDDETRDSLVPNLLLQPLVENAIKHGISRRFTPGWVRLGAKRLNSRLCLSVDDDGPGTKTETVSLQEGIGLGNTRNRLQTLYGSDFRLELASLTNGGTRVLIDLPWREKSSGAGLLEARLAI